MLAALVFTSATWPSRAHAAPQMQAVPPLTQEALANATYLTSLLPSGQAQLTNGRFEDAGAQVLVVLTGPQTSRDLNGDGAPDAVVVLAANTGGSGVFSFVSAVLNDNGVARPLPGVVLGDRIRVQSVAISRRGEITVRYLDRRPTQPMSARPTIRRVASYKLAQSGDALISLTPLSNAALSNAEYPLEGTPDGRVFLSNGRYEDAEAQLTVTLQRLRAYGDINGDGSPDTAVTLVSNSGGSGVFSWVSAVLNDNDAAVPMATTFIGDRVRLRSVVIRNGQITVTYYDRRADQPMAARPTVLTRKTFVLEGNQLVDLAARAAAPAGAAPAESHSYAFACAGGKSFTVVFGDQTAVVTFDGRTQTLPQQVSGSGIRYANDEWEFQGKGVDGALLDAQTGETLAGECVGAPVTTGAETATITGTVPGALAVSRSYSFTCAGGASFSVVFQGSDAIVTFNGQTQTLPQQVSGSGIRYANDEWEFRGKGVDGTLVDVQTGQTLAGECAGTLVGMGVTTPTITVTVEGAPADAGTITGTVEGAPADAGTITGTVAGAVPSSLSGILTGTVTYRQRIALPPQAVVEVQLQDVSRADAPGIVLGSQMFQTGPSQAPFSFELRYAPELIAPNGSYAVRARVTVDGDLAWTNTEIVGVLTRGQPATGVEVVVNQVEKAPESPAPQTPVTPVLTVTNAIVDVLASDPRFATLAAAIEAAGLTDTLQSAGPFTLFAPTNDAFAKLPEGALEQLMQNRRLLTDILLYHVVTPTLTAAEIAQQTTLQPLLTYFPLPVSAQEGVLRIKDARVVEADIQVVGGIVHAIDEVLTPIEIFGMADQPAPLTGVLTGTLTYRQRVALDPQAVISVQLQDVSRADAAATIVASQTITAGGQQVPIPFELSYDPATIEPQGVYIVAVRITLNDKLIWITATSHRVLTRESPVTGIEVVVEPVSP